MTERDGGADYPYEGLPFTPAVAAYLILKLFGGQTVKRQEIIKAVFGFHLAHGGEKQSTGKPWTRVKAALKVMKKRELAKSRSSGHYYVVPGSFVPSEFESDLTENALETDESGEFGNEVPVQSEDVLEIKPEIELGSGKGAVYLYYFPTYRRMAEQDGETNWRCKIGKSEGNPLGRISNQVGTSLPEVHHVALVVRTPDATSLEATLHGALKQRKRTVSDAPGTEWFFTTPEEVLSIIKFISPHLMENE